jgi:uncharacterized protein (DUF1330 family)
VTAYVITEVDVEDPQTYREKYGPLATASVERHGGTFLARGGKTEVLEGEWSDRIVVIEFESLDAARNWYHSDDYQAAAPIRHAASRGRMIVVEGTGP